MWPCYGVHVHITVLCMAFLVCVFCQPVHSYIKTSLHQLDFFLEIFYRDLFLFFLIKLNSLRGAAMRLRLMRQPRTCEWHPTVCPLNLPRKKAQAVSPN